MRKLNAEIGHVDDCNRLQITVK